MLDLLPQMTHPLRGGWDQPNKDQIAFYEDMVIMDQNTLDLLHEYSASIPTGVYEGKMWKCRVGEKWILCWYGLSDDPDKCSINRRPIRILRTLLKRRV